jgi:hypothetical protein
MGEFILEFSRTLDTNRHSCIRPRTSPSDWRDLWVMSRPTRVLGPMISKALLLRDHGTRAQNYRLVSNFAPLTRLSRRHPLTTHYYERDWLGQ